MDSCDIYDRSESLVHHVPLCVTFITQILGQATLLSDTTPHNSLQSMLLPYV